MISTGDLKIDAAANNLLNHIQSTMKNKFVMQWRGSKVPRGAKLGGMKIIWTQHGSIYNGKAKSR